MQDAMSSLFGKILTLLAVSCTWLAVAGGLPAHGLEPSEDRLQVVLTPLQDSFSLHEPIQVTLEIRNGLDRPLHFDLGSNAKGSLTFSFVRPDGQRVSSKLPQPVDDFSAFGEVKLSSGQAYRQTLVLNEWEGFDQVGNYTIEVTVPTPKELAAGCEAASASTQLRVTPREPARLKFVCERLEATVLQGTPEQGREAAEALSFAADDVCIPSLARLLKGSFLGRVFAIQGLARLRTTAAVATIVDVWEELDRTSRQRLLSEFTFVGQGELLRDALRRAGKKATN